MNEVELIERKFCLAVWGSTDSELPEQPDQGLEMPPSPRAGGTPAICPGQGQALPHAPRSYAARRREQKPCNASGGALLISRVFLAPPSAPEPEELSAKLGSTTLAISPGHDPNLPPAPAAPPPVAESRGRGGLGDDRRRGDGGWQSGSSGPPTRPVSHAPVPGESRPRSGLA